MTTTLTGADLDAAADGVEALLTASVDNGGSFSCGEADAIADMIRALGFLPEADEFIENHAAHDDEGDTHYLCQQCHEAPAEEHSMCGSCLHDAKRSGWEPGTEET